MTFSMGRRETLLAIDVGTQSIRALVFDPLGELIDMARVVYEQPYHSPYPGWAEQDADYYWKCLIDACQLLWKNGKAAPETISSVTLTSQRGTVVNLGADGKPLRPAILWLDQRKATELPSLGMGWNSLFALTSLKKTVLHLQAEAEWNWLLEHQPEVVEATKHYLFLSGYLVYQLTGEIADSIGCQVGYVPFDYKKHSWITSEWNWKRRALPIDSALLPRLVPPGMPIGEVTRRAAELTGLPPGLPVIAAAADKACEVLGSGSHLIHQGCVGYGTTATISVNATRYIEPIPLVPPYPSANSGTYNLEVQTFRGLWMVSWFIEQFAGLEKRLAKEQHLSCEELLEAKAAAVPPGSMGLILQPYWSPGIRYPHPEAKGAIIGFGGDHTKDHLYRAILEGLAFAVREGRERIEKRSKVPITELYVCGGGSRSDLLVQITADVFQTPVNRPKISETSGLGAAMLAAVGSRLYPDLPTAVQAMAAVSRVFEPDPEAAKIYEELYQRVYRKLYRKLRPLYQAIQRITGYPELSD